MREDGAELRLVRRACSRLHLDQIRPHGLGLVQYLQTIGYKAWIEDANGNVIEETVLKNAIK
jgi:hypothetical protein